ncbi:MAG: CoA-binding protein [Bdellovibrionaceae bacterium]|nr:CoA-binding protein [Pseudobdellovibrionaceae bacterium]
MGQTDSSKHENVAILGASDRADRFAYKAFKLLQEYGHTPLPVSPNVAVVEGVPSVKSVAELQVPVDTLTMYVGAKISNQLTNEILALKPKRVIFNPGSENPELADKLEQAGSEVVEACTLVMLRTGQY